MILVAVLRSRNYLISLLLQFCILNRLKSGSGRIPIDTVKKLFQQIKIFLFVSLSNSRHKKLGSATLVHSSHTYISCRLPVCIEIFLKSSKRRIGHNESYEVSFIISIGFLGGFFFHGAICYGAYQHVSTLNLHICSTGTY